MATAEVLDVPQLSKFCSLPPTSIDTLLDAPTTDLVRTLLQNIGTKAREYDEAKSGNLKLSIELENAVRGGDAKNRLLKTSVEKGLKEAADIRHKLQDEEQARATVEEELQSLKSSTSSSTEEVNKLQAHIASLESSKRDTVSSLESKSTAYDSLAEELANQHQKTVELKRQVSALEQSTQSANAESHNAKLHEQGLRQEIEQLKRNNDWLDNELKTKSDEHSKLRREKGARIAELQRQNDELSSNIDALTRTEKTLRTRLDEVGEKADDAFNRIQKLQEEAVQQKQAHDIEIEAKDRLAKLMENSRNTERQRQQDLNNQLETLKEEASEEIGKVTAECDTEHREREAAEGRIVELEARLEQLEADIAALQDRESARGSPVLGINGSMTPNRPDSRMASPSPARLKGGMSVTKLYSDNNDLRAEVNQLRRRKEDLEAAVDEMTQGLEAKLPEIEELQTENSRLVSDVTEMTTLLEASSKERDQALKEAKRSQAQITARIKEGDVLRQQLRDLSSQVKVLLMEMHLRNQGHDELDPEQHLQLERLAQGQIDDEDMDEATDTNRFISQNLVTFKNIAELEEQNNKLMKVTRELGEKMEHEEALRKQSTEAAQSREELQQKLEQYKDEIKALVTQSESYIRERDIFKRMLLHRGHDLNSISGESMDGDLPGTPSRSVLNSIERSPDSKSLAEYAKLVKDLQAYTNSLRQESATDRATLQQQVDSVSRQNSELRGEVSRSGSQVALAHERYEMLQANYGMLKTENTELQKRSQIYSEAAAKQELRIQQVSEDLIVAKGLADSMRNETANLKAEKDFWKGIEKRLTEDNENLSNEQKRLNALNANLQNLLNEREHSDNDSRRRSQAQVENLERDLQATKSKLDEEMEDNKRAVARREYEGQQSQKRIDDLISSLGLTREELIAAKATRDHLQARVDELTIELRSAEERVQLLQPAQTNHSSGANREQQNDEANEDETHQLSKEQELGVQVSELKRDLDLARGDLENAKSQVEQYKAISQSSEEELQSLNETQEMYRQETDQTIEDKNAKIKHLEDRIADTSEELASRDSELSELRSSQSEHDRRLEEQKASFDTEKAQLKDEADRQSSAAHFYQEDLKAQAEIAQQAQQNYENELVKHAEAAKSIQKVRNDYNQVKLELVEVKTEVESTKTSLTQNEESWSEAKGRYEREVADLKVGRESINAQNNRLLQQLDDVSTQIAQLKKRKDTEEGGEPSSEDAADVSSSAGLENLQEVIRYLRREKEIVDVQYSIKETESKGLQQQLDYTQKQLDETRLRLNQHRRLEQESERSSLTHNKLMETINELSTFRESNVTLRNETRQAQAALALKSQNVEELQAQVEPLQAEVQELKNHIETQTGEARLLKEDRDRWHQRVQDILQKYDRIDPAEMEALKNKLQSLETERDEMTASKTALQEQYDAVAAQVAQAQEQATERVADLRLKLTDQFKARSKQQSEKIAESNAALQAALKEKQGLEEQVSTLQQQLDTAQAEKERSASNASNGDEQPEVEEGQLEDDAPPKVTNEDAETLRSQLSGAETKANEEASRATSLQEQLTTAQARIAELEPQVAQLQHALDEANAESAQLREQHQQVSTSAATASEEQLDKLRQALDQAQRDAENLRATASINESIGTTTAENGEKSVSDQITERVETMRVELEAKYNDRSKVLEENFNKRAQNMKTQLTGKLATVREQAKQAVAADHEKQMQELKAAHEQELEQLQAKRQGELDELKQGEESRLTQAKEAWMAEHPASGSIVKNEDPAARPSTDLTDAEVKELIKNNALIRTTLRERIDRKVNEAKEAVTLQLKEEHDKTVNEATEAVTLQLKEEHGQALVDRLAEAQIKANTAKDQAVDMATKRNQIKISIAENKAKLHQAKLGVVQTAATETPQKPVIEVWEVAKDAKPEVVTAPASAVAGNASGKPSAASAPLNLQPSRASAPTASVPVQKQAATSAFGQPSSAAQTIQAPGQKPTSAFGQPSAPSKPSTAFGQRSNVSPNNQIEESKPAQTSSFGKPSAPQTQAIPPSTQTGTQQSPTQPQQPNIPRGPAQKQFSSSSPKRSSPKPSGNQANATTSQPVNGTQPTRQSPPRATGDTPPKPPAPNNPFAQSSGPAAARSLQQSGLPVAAGGRGRGAGNQRGRGRGRGGGGGQSVDTAQAQGGQQGRASPTSAGLNPGARQFVPGNKRPREDGHDGDGNGKRIRGGGDAS